MWSPCCGDETEFHGSGVLLGAMGTSMGSTVVETETSLRIGRSSPSAGVQQEQWRGDHGVLCPAYNVGPIRSTVRGVKGDPTSTP